MGRIEVGDIVKHFKREIHLKDGASYDSKYVYKILAFANHTESKEKLVIYQAMYFPFTVYARPYDMFMGIVDKEKYPQIQQKYRFEKID